MKKLAPKPNPISNPKPSPKNRQKQSMSKTNEDCHPFTLYIGGNGHVEQIYLGLCKPVPNNGLQHGFNREKILEMDIHVDKHIYWLTIFT